MTSRLKIIIIGDYNFTYNSHHATNLAFDHAAHFLDLDISYYWVKHEEVLKFKPQQFMQYDGIFIAPGPIKNPFYFHAIIKELSNKKIPTIITGTGFKTLLDVLIQRYRLNPNNEKLISENLMDGNHFEQIHVTPNSSAFIELYKNYSKTELTSNRHSMYPLLIQQLSEDLVDIEAYNQFEEPEIISLKNHDFFVACGFYPQISSTRELPHPLIYTFVKMCQVSLDMKSA